MTFRRFLVVTVLCFIAFKVLSPRYGKVAPHVVVAPPLLSPTTAPTVDSPTPTEVAAAPTEIAPTEASTPFLTPFETPAEAQPLVLRGDLPLSLPAPATAPQITNPALKSRIAALQGKIARAKIFAAYRELAETYVAQGLYKAAAQTYREEAAQYRQKGFSDAAIIEDLKAARYDTRTQLFIDRVATQQELNTLYTNAPLEPFVGCYIGAFIDRDTNLVQTFMDENWQTHRSPDEWAQYIGKPHGSLFMYLSYGNKFPTKWVERLKEANVIPHIAWEPRSLNTVQDDAYLRSFAQACRDADWPIFFRFASEMNGKWTPYHGDPKLYREKFRLVHKVLHRYAPRIATIWCVNNPPLGNANDYYPGDDGCDWVGVNFYSVPFYENKRDRPGLLDSPLALLDPVYNRYSGKKPIAICEYAASHRPALDNVLRNDFALQKMSILYGALPRIYPRVKLVDWFNMNSIQYPQPGKTLNDYTLTNEKAILRNYRQLILPPYFLSSWQRLGDPRPPLPRPVQNGQKLRLAARFSVWSNFQLPNTKTYFQLGSKIIYASRKPGVHEINLDLSRGPFGRQPATVYIYDERNHLVTMTRTMVNISR